MTTINTRPKALDLLYRSGNAQAVALTWPAGSLVGRTFTATLEAAPLGLAVVGDVMTITATDAQTLVAPKAAEFLLTETTAGSSDVRLVGDWVHSNAPNAGSPLSLTVTLDDAQVIVDLSGNAELNAHTHRLHKSHVVVPAAWGSGRWYTARDEADTRQVKVHMLSDSIFQGTGATFPRTQGCAELTAQALRDEYGDGGTGWLPSALTSPQFRVTTTGVPTGGTFSLHAAVNGGGSEETAPIAFNASAATIAAAIEALANVPTGTVKASDGPLPTGVAVVFVGDLADDNVVLTAGDNNLTGGAAPQITVTNPWTQGMGMGGCQMRATAVGAALHFADMRGTNIRGFHRNASTTGSFRWRLDGGAWNTVTPPTAFGQDPGAFDTGTIADTPHTIDIEWLSGTVDIFGIEATRTTGIVVYRFAQSGRAASDFTPGVERKIGLVSASGATTTLTCTSPGSFTSDLVGRFAHGVSQIPAGTTVTAVGSATSLTLSASTTGGFTNQTLIFSTGGTLGVLGANMLADPFLAAAIGRPDLVILQLGANDPAGANNSADTYRAGISKLLRLYSDKDVFSYSPDVILVIEHIGTWFDLEGEFAAMAAVAADVAGGNGAALVDIWGLGRRSWKYWNDLGFFADAIHPSTAGHVQYAQPVIDLTTT